MRGEKRLGGAPDAAGLLPADGLERVTEAVPAAHLDLAEDEPAPSPHDEIQLVAARPGIGGEHAIPAQHVEATHPPLGGRAGRVHGTTAADSA